MYLFLPTLIYYIVVSNQEKKKKIAYEARGLSRSLLKGRHTACFAWRPGLLSYCDDLFNMLLHVIYVILRSSAMVYYITQD